MYIEASRRIVEEQDRAYAECLRADQEKVYYYHCRHVALLIYRDVYTQAARQEQEKQNRKAQQKKAEVYEQQDTCLWYPEAEYCL